MDAMYDVVTIGSATRDNFLEADFKLTDWQLAPSGKAIALPFGEKLAVKSAYFTTGGNAANAAVTFARQGFKTACAAKIGDDLSGRELLSRLKKEKVDTAHIAVASNGQTAYSVLLLKDGERTILAFPGAANKLTRVDLVLKLLKAKWWYISLSGESDVLFPELVSFAKKNNIKIAFNPTGHHIAHRKDEIIAAFRDLSFLVLNRGEAAELVGIPFTDEVAVFKKLDELTPGIVAVTDGPNGATVSDGKYLYKAGIFKEKTVVDRTGAGDAFGSAFVAGLMESLKEEGVSDKVSADIPYAIRFASANATSVVEHIGATEGILTREEFKKSSRWHKLAIGVSKS